MRLDGLMKTLQAHQPVWTGPQEPRRWPDQISPFVELPGFTEEMDPRGAGLRAGRPETRQVAIAAICKTHFMGELVEKRARRIALNSPKPETVPLPPDETLSRAGGSMMRVESQGDLSNSPCGAAEGGLGLK